MRMRCVTPSLLAADIEATVEFYVGVLGFTLDTLWPEEAPTVAILDHGPVHLLFHTETCDDGEPPSMTGALRFDVDDVAGLHRRLSGHVEVLWGPEVYHYGRREFSIRDPDGYELVFSEPTDDAPTCREP